jgi:hypothetical protein
VRSSYQVAEKTIGSSKQCGELQNFVSRSYQSQRVEIVQSPVMKWSFSVWVKFQPRKQKLIEIGNVGNKRRSALFCFHVGELLIFSQKWKNQADFISSYTVLTHEYPWSTEGNCDCCVDGCATRLPEKRKHRMIKMHGHRKHHQTLNFFKSAGTSPFKNDRRMIRHIVYFCLRISGTFWKLRGFHGSQWFFRIIVSPFFARSLRWNEHWLEHLLYTRSGALLCSPRLLSVFVQCWSSKSHPADLVGFY